MSQKTLKSHSVITDECSVTTEVATNDDTFNYDNIFPMTTRRCRDQAKRNKVRRTRIRK